MQGKLYSRTKMYWKKYVGAVDGCENETIVKDCHLNVLLHEEKRGERRNKKV